MHPLQMRWWKIMLLAVGIIAAGVPVLREVKRRASAEPAEREEKITPRLLSGVREEAAVRGFGDGDSGAQDLLARFLEGAELSDGEFAVLLEGLSRAEPSVLAELEREDLKALMNQWVKRDFNGAMSALIGLPEETLRRLIIDLEVVYFADVPPLEIDTWPEMWVLRKWAARDYAGAEAWLNAQADMDKEAHDSLLLGKIDSLEKDAAVDFILERWDNGMLHDELSNVVGDWIVSDGESALNWLDSIPSDHPFWEYTGTLGFVVVYDYQKKVEGSVDSARVIEWSGKFPKGRIRQEFLNGAVIGLVPDEFLVVSEDESSECFVAMRDIVNAMEEDNLRVDSVVSLSTLWTFKDPVAASEWLAGLPESRSRDAGVEELAEGLYEADPDSARRWAETISDQVHREKVLKSLRERGLSQE